MRVTVDDPQKLAERKLQCGAHTHRAHVRVPGHDLQMALALPLSLLVCRDSKE